MRPSLGQQSRKDTTMPVFNDEELREQFDADLSGVISQSEKLREARSLLVETEVEYMRAKYELKRSEAIFMVEQPIPGKNQAERDAYLFDQFVEENTAVNDLECAYKRARSLFDIEEITYKEVMAIIRIKELYIGERMNSV